MYHDAQKSERYTLRWTPLVHTRLRLGVARGRADAMAGDGRTAETVWGVGVGCQGKIDVEYPYLECHLGSPGWYDLARGTIRIAARASNDRKNCSESDRKKRIMSQPRRVPRHLYVPSSFPADRFLAAGQRRP